MQIDFFVINLDRSPDRLAAIEADAASLGIRLIRIAAVDGKSVPESDRTILDRRGFLRRHGKHPMDGEYGCYASHLVALRRIADGEADAAVIFEDDVRPLPELLPVLEALGAVDDWDLVRFAHHRGMKNRAVRSLPTGRRLCATYFGPTGSTAAYIVRRAAAATLLRTLVPMQLPLDVALERGWATGVRTFDIRPDLVAFSPLSKISLTQADDRYGAMKLKPWRRLPTLSFRSREAIRRIAYAAKAGRGS